jgi:hypothetical protein
MSAAQRKVGVVSGIAIALCAAHSALGAGADTDRINGDDARTLLGPGTGVVVGIVDTGVDASQPALAGTVSSGQPRLLAQQNFSGDTNPINQHGATFQPETIRSRFRTVFWAHHRKNMGSPGRRMKCLNQRR